MRDSKRPFDWAVLRPRTAGEQPPPAPTDAPVREGHSSEPTTDYRLPDTSSTTDDRLPATSIPLRVNDLKQYAYCPRIVFYHYAMPVQRKATFKMERGKMVEKRIEQLEQRRKVREYGLEEGERHFQVWLTSPRLGLSGRLDLMITTPGGAVPVDFKDTRERVHHNHHVQLCAYALLVEDVLQKPVATGFIYRVPRDDLVAVEITPALRVETMQAIEEIRRMIRTERMPPPTAVRARCADCEYRNYCGDIF